MTEHEDHACHGCHCKSSAKSHYDAQEFLLNNHFLFTWTRLHVALLDLLLVPPIPAGSVVEAALLLALLLDAHPVPLPGAAPAALGALCPLGPPSPLGGGLLAAAEADLVVGALGALHPIVLVVAVETVPDLRFI